MQYFVRNPIVGNTKFKLTELKARDTFCPKGKKVEPKRIKAIGI